LPRRNDAGSKLHSQDDLTYRTRTELDVNEDVNEANEDVNEDANEARAAVGTCRPPHEAFPAHL
jgi:hypothetical protein